MTRHSRIRNLAALLIVGAFGAGCTASTQQTGSAVSQGGMGASGPLTVEQQKVLRREFAITKADIDFMSGMISHHAQAVVMAGWAPSRGASAAVVGLCERIVVAQNDEIDLMQRWLSEHGQPVPVADAKGMKMEMGGMTHAMLMPGMLTEDEMKALDQARGVEFDRLFLIGMIKHHQGALTMVQTLVGSYGAAQDDVVFKFSSDVSADQSTEIERMQTMLDALPPPKVRP